MIGSGGEDLDEMAVAISMTADELVDCYPPLGQAEYGGVGSDGANRGSDPAHGFAYRAE